MLSRSIQELHPDLEFAFATNVPTAPVVYVSDAKMDAYQAINPVNRKHIVGSKASPLGTSHKIHVSLPKRDATYHFLVVIAYTDPKKNKMEYLTLWSDSVSVSTPKSF